MPRFKSTHPGDPPAARVALACASLVIVALLVAAGARSAAASSPGSASTESFRSDAAAIEGPATIGLSGRRLVPFPSRAVATGLAMVVVSGIAGGPARPAPGLRSPLVVLDDVGDRWRALLIGAPPARSSF